MSNQFLFVQTQKTTLAGSGCTATATSIILKSFKLPDGSTTVTMANFGGVIGFGTLEQGTAREEQISFTGITQNADGTATLTGVTRGVRFVSPYDEVTANKIAHAGGSSFVISNTSGFYSRMVSEDNDETITGLYTFTQFPQKSGSTSPTLPAEFATKAYADALAIAGAPNASTSVQGLVQEATQAQVDAKTATGSTGAKLFAPLDKARSTLLSDYKVDTGAANAYVITPSPAITAYTTGQIFSFKAVNANTTASTLNVNGLGAKSIVKSDGSTALVANDIKASQIVVVEYDGTSFIMISQSGNLALNVNGSGASLTGITSSQISGSFSQLASTFTAGETITAGQAVAMYPYQTDGGIKIDTSGTFHSTSQSITVGNNANRGLVVFLTTDSNASINSVAYNGIAMTQISLSIYAASNYRGASYYLSAPSTGANNLTISLSGGSAYVAYYSVYNVSQSSQPEAWNSNGGSTANNLSLSTIANGAMMFSALAAGGGGYTISGTGAYANALNSGPSWVYANTSGQVFPAATSITYSNSNNAQWAKFMLSLAPANPPVDGGVKLASSASATSQFQNLYDTFIGFANANSTIGNPIAVTTVGQQTGLTSLVPEKLYYLSDTPGAISTTAGTNTRKVGISTSSTTLVITNNW